MGLLRDMFDEVLVEAILRLPVPNSSLEDKWVWTKEPTSIFTVRSFLRDEQERCVPAMLLLDKRSWNLL